MNSDMLKQDILNKVKEYYKLYHANKQTQFIEGKTKINYAGRVFDEKEMENLVDSSLDFWLTAGKYTEQFEKNLANFLGVKWAFLVNSGSSANLLAFYALTSPLLKERQIKRGDEVITVAAGFPTTIAPVVQYGAVPVFVDMELQFANVDVTQLEKALSSRTKAIMIAHSLGNPFNIKAIKEFCDKNNLWLIEDNCDALGSKYDDKYTGTWGDIGTSSFYPAHHITMGEGGAVYTNNTLLKKIILSMRDWGRDCWCKGGKDNTCGCRFTQQFGSLPKGYDHKYVYSHFGFNLKATDMQAAIGCAQLEKLPEFIKKRQLNYQKLYSGLKNLTELHLVEAQPNSQPSWFGFMITLKDDAKFTRNEITSFLEECNIQTRTLFAGNIIRHPVFDTLEKDKDY
ncbi:lipopolysaccharide biosynthesis protein RfbH, partial [Campylobacter coli]